MFEVVDRIGQCRVGLRPGADTPAFQNEEFGIGCGCAPMVSAGAIVAEFAAMVLSIRSERLRAKASASAYPFGVSGP